MDLFQQQDDAIAKLKKAVPHLFQHAKDIGTGGVADFTHRKIYKKQITDIFGHQTDFIFAVTVIILAENKYFFQISEGTAEYNRILAQYVMNGHPFGFWKVDSI